MKRFLVVMLLVTMMSTSAYADYDKEITFRGLPMGSSIQEVKSQLIKEGLKESSFIVEPNALLNTVFFTLYEEKYDYLKVEDAGYSVFTVETEGMELAGYDILSLDLDFIYDTENGVLNKEQEKAGLSDASYSLFLADDEQPKVFADLKRKLTSLYDNPSETISETETNFIGEDYIQNLVIWYGANDTVVFTSCLWFTVDGVNRVEKTGYSLFSNADNSINVTYGKTDTIEKLKLIQNFNNPEEPTNNDTTGL